MSFLEFLRASACVDVSAGEVLINSGGVATYHVDRYPDNGVLCRAQRFLL